MDKFVQQVKNFWNDESGITAVEYALIVAIIAVAVFFAWGTLGNGINNAFQNLATNLSS